MKLGKILASVIPIVASSWVEQAWAVWDCKAYADFAIRDVNKAQAAQCGFTGPRWSADSGLHYGFCVERLGAGDDNAMTVETDTRQREVAECEKTYAANVLCPDYAKRAIQAVNEAAQLGCNFQPPRWSTDEGLHYGYCIDRTNAGDRGSLISETDARRADLAECKLASAPKTGGTQRVKQQVELYDNYENGNRIEPDVNAGTEVTLGECKSNNMCSIQEVGGRAGWIYDGADYDTLNR